MEREIQEGKKRSGKPSLPVFSIGDVSGIDPRPPHGLSPARRMCKKFEGQSGSVFLITNSFWWV